METNDLVPSLMFMTLIIVAAIAAIALALFLRKRSNRKPMEKSPDGALTHAQAERSGHPR